MHRAASYEDFRRHRDFTLSSGKKAESSAGASSIRKAKSESDVTVVSLRKKLDVSDDPLPASVRVECCVLLDFGTHARTHVSSEWLGPCLLSH